MKIIEFFLRKITTLTILSTGFISFIIISSLSAEESLPVELSAKGKVLESEYSKQLKKLREELIAVLPAFAQEKQAKDLAAKKKAEEEERLKKEGPEFSADLSILDGDSEFEDDLSLPEPVNKKKIKEEPKIAHEVIIDAFAKFNESESKLSRLAKSDPLERVKRDIEWTKSGVASCEKGIEKVKKTLHTATSDFNRKKIEDSIASWQKKREGGLKKLEALQAKMKEIEAAQPAYKKSIADAFEQYKKAKGHLEAMTKKTGVSAVLSEDKLDAKLVKYVVLYMATPRGLAEFAEKSSHNASLIESLLNNTPLMKQMLIADGAKAKRTRGGFEPAQYGPAMKIYSEIQKASARSKGGIFQRLALAISLEHSIPIKQSNPQAVAGPEFVDPVKRYLYFEKAYLEQDIDPHFGEFTVWEYRHVINGDEPDETLTWGRKTLRNFRPNLIHMDSESWRYVSFVPSDVSYGSGDVKYDLPELQKYQNILMNGGICGRRAFFGRFILRSFGIPAIARPSKGHGALARWTSKGWVVCLGPGWGAGWTATKYRKDRDFLASAQARENIGKFLQVKRAQWIGDVFEEPRVYGEAETETKQPRFWNEISLKTQRAVIQSEKVETLKAIGEHLGESNSTAVVKSDQNEENSLAGKVTANKDGSILIDATAYNQKNVVGVSPIESYDGGTQINLKRFGLTGLTVMRGNSSGWRMKSGGYGAYDNWGFRVAMTHIGRDTPRELTVEIADGVTMDFVYIKPGSFTMGGENNKDGRFECVELPKHAVTITKGFYMGKYEVTQKQFEAVMGYNCSQTTIDPDCPVNKVDWSSTLKFCELVSFKSKKTVRLPTEAEWEYAARAGTSAKWFFGDDPSKLGDYAWIISDSAEKKTYKVGQKKPNPWGLYDIYGNVIERVADIYDKNYYARSPEKDPTGPDQPVTTYFEYEVNALQGGIYELTANVVTTKHTQFLSAAVNDSKDTHIKLPFTVGRWQESEPVKVTLKKGKNILRFKRIHPPQKGVAIKAFKLKPVK